MIEQPTQSEQYIQSITKSLDQYIWESSVKMKVKNINSDYNNILEENFYKKLESFTERLKKDEYTVKDLISVFNFFVLNEKALIQFKQKTMLLVILNNIKEQLVFLIPFLKDNVFEETACKNKITYVISFIDLFSNQYN